jgi:hypothetical protein
MAQATAILIYDVRDPSPGRTLTRLIRRETPLEPANHRLITRDQLTLLPPVEHPPFDDLGQPNREETEDR